MSDEKDEINLGTSRREAYNMDDPKIVGGEGEEVIYPTFHYSGPLDLDLPDHGDMSIHFRKLDEKYDIDPDTGKHTHYECTVQVRKICDVEEEKDEAPSRSYDDASDALDKIASEMSKEKDAD